MRFFPAIPFLRKVFNRDKEFAAIDAGIAAAAGVTDAGERLLRYNDLGRDSRRIGNDILFTSATPALIGLGAAMVMFGVGLFYGLGVLAIMALPTAYAAIAAGRETGRDTFDKVDARSAQCDTAMDGLMKDTGMRAFALSPAFNTVMQRFPALRQKFLLAAAREKFAADAAPAPPKPALLKL